MPKKKGLGEMFDDTLETIGLSDDTSSKSKDRKGGKTSKGKKIKKSSKK